MQARTDRGTKLRWDKQSDMIRPDSLLFPVLAITGLPGPSKLPLTKPQALQVYKSLVNASQTFERIDARQEAEEWIDGFMRTVGREIETDLRDPAKKFVAILDMQGYEADTADLGQAYRWAAPPVLVDISTGDMYVGSLDLMDHLKKSRRIVVGWPELNAKLEEIGWSRCELQQWQPDVPRADGTKARFKAFRFAGGDGG
jgi:hypothetical protein